MRIRGIDVAGGLAVVGIILLVALTVWPLTTGTTATVAPASGDSILGPPAATTTPTASASPTPSPSAPEPSKEASPTATPEPESSGLSPEQRATVGVQVLNGGAPEGAAAAATSALADQSFQPRSPENAVDPVVGTLVLHAPDNRLAADIVAQVLGVAPDAVTESAQDPNWIAYGADLDVLVVLASPLP